ncbi:MAG: folylpolyglutamate synthase/dihydrofolate synthase family protein [Anaerolineales bacterium]
MDTETRYNQALDYLYSFVDYSLKKSSELAAANFDLSRMRDFLALLGDPQDKFPTIHVAGTKGKGSTAAFCASALQAAGYKTGLYTSPHLLDFCERIQINGQPISHAELADLVDEIKAAVAQIAMLTTFEISTALGFLYFARQGCQAAVIEVGLGGRLDATNLITPRVSVITALSYDHTAVLGNTLEKIAAEKAGIIKNGIPVISAPQQPAALTTLEAIAAQRSAPLTLVGRDLSFSPLSHSLDGQDFRIHPQLDLHIPLLGAHQIENAVTAFAALRQSGLALSEEAIRAGFAAARWPCRFEIFQRENPPIILDSAHNEDSFRRLAQTLGEYFPGRPVILILGISEDKHLAAMLAAMHGIINRLIITRSRHPRALEPEKIIETAHQAGLAYEVVTPVEAAVARGLEIARQQDALLLSAGSMFVTAAVKEILFKGIL